MFYYAITINRNHKWYALEVEKDTPLTQYKTRAYDVGFISNVIHQALNIRYLELVIHKNDTTDYHVHGLIISDNEITKELVKEKCHIETVLNLGKYQQYMINHDVEYHAVYGEMPYIEEEDAKKLAYNEMLSYFFSSRSAVKTVQRFGIMALKYYRQLKDMETYDL